MCAIVGAIFNEPSAADFELLRRVFVESKIRGMHATGVSYIKHDRIETLKLPVPADKFPFDFASYVNEDGNLYMVGHCRYSTSDLIYNQPISNNEYSVVHNGVISQELHENWKQLYGYDCSTKNDTELILKTLEEQKCVLNTWQDASIAACELWQSKKIRFYRNGKRPVYRTMLNNGVVITSTSNIAGRAGMKNAEEVPMNTYITVDSSLEQNTIIIENTNSDLQRINYE